MTEPTRRERVEAMLADDPADRFLRYSLAMELRKENNHERSLSLLDELKHEDSPYVAAFFMSAKQLVNLGRIDEARASLRDGIEAARQQGDSHAAAEMSELLTTLGQIGS